MRTLTNVILVCCLVFSIAPMVRGSSITENLKIYFDHDVLEPVQELLCGAREEILIEMFSFTNYLPIINTIQSVRSRQDNNVEIRIILDNQGANDPLKKDGTGFPEETLEKAYHCQIRWRNESKQSHRKLALVDNERIFIGSTNWSKNGFELNDEASVIFTDKVIGKQIRDEFDKDWLRSVDIYP